MSDADLVVLGVPVAKTAEVLAAIQPSLGSGTLLTDVGSTKGSVIQAAGEVFGELPECFVPGHPIAGSEQIGYEHAREELFRGRRVILTPTENTNAEALQRIRALWQAIGARVDELSAEQHDLILSATSHLPHMLAYALVDMLGNLKDRTEIFGYSAGGLRDFTRVASSDPQMWHDICLANREAMVDAIDRFSSELDRLTDAVRRGDGEYVRTVFTRAKAIRDRYS